MGFERPPHPKRNRIGRRLVAFAIILVLCPLSRLLASDPVVVYRFDPDSIQDVTGTIAVIHEAHWYGAERPNWVVEIQVESDEILFVDLGPEDLHRNGPIEGSTLQATGSRIEAEGQHILLATKVKIDDHRRVTIRNGKGVPVWVQKGMHRSGQGHQFRRPMNRSKRMRRMH